MVCGHRAVKTFLAVLKLLVEMEALAVNFGMKGLELFSEAVIGGSVGGFEVLVG